MHDNEVIIIIIILHFQQDLFTVIHKHYSLDEWKQFASENKDLLKVGYNSEN